MLRVSGEPALTGWICLEINVDPDPLPNGSERVIFRDAYDVRNSGGGVGSSDIMYGSIGDVGRFPVHAPSQLSHSPLVPHELHHEVTATGGNSATFLIFISLPDC